MGPAPHRKIKRRSGSRCDVESPAGVVEAGGDEIDGAGGRLIPLEVYMTQANSSSDPESLSPLSANLPHRPADDTEEVYYEGSPLLRGAIFKGFLWILVGLV